MIGITGNEIMNPDGKHERVRRCATCGEIVGITQLGSCPRCSGPLITLGPINWTKEDELEAGKEFVGLPEDMEEEEEEYQDIVCMLWDMIEMLEVEIDDRDNDIEELGDTIGGLNSELVITKNAVKMVDNKVKELEAKLADQTLKGKVKKSFGK